MGSATRVCSVALVGVTTPFLMVTLTVSGARGALESVAGAFVEVVHPAHASTAMVIAVRALIVILDSS
jgi:hypothetical protein